MAVARGGAPRPPRLWSTSCWRPEASAAAGLLERPTDERSAASERVRPKLSPARWVSGRRRTWCGSARRGSPPNAFGPHHCAPTVPAGSAPSANQPTSAVSSGCGSRSPPVAVQWNSSMYMAKREKPIRWPSITASSCSRLARDAGLFGDLLDGDLGGRVPDVGPPGRVQPEAGVGALHEEDLATVVADDRTDRHLRRDVAGHVDADRLHPLLDEVGQAHDAPRHPAAPRWRPS